ncbi:hypothetical protein FA10DRAFT_299525 [Acaromyces ingoldii]|uniref:Wax synthase domain-containing protein n=1 Tax=Acaromyces ingoldii TaxID=215250 RepID=A0A316YYP0_9BASI|nr:hypothetical protein FA10DRAFT_299525 [Acaromyces ingoldii]PWN94222.1 hypothetical protein FA10DRAFT_299525 [Acaromyces ingoldii]
MSPSTALRAGGPAKATARPQAYALLAVSLLSTILFSHIIGTLKGKQADRMTAFDFNMTVSLLTLLVMPGLTTTVASILALLIVSHMTLPWQTFEARLLRAGLLFPITAYLIFHMATDPAHTLGNNMRDLCFGTMAWNLIAKTLDVNLVTLFDDHAPRWCVPDWDKERSLLASKSDTITENKEKLETKKGKKVSDSRPWPCFSNSTFSLQKRPLWASRDYVPVHWMLVDPPQRLFSMDRLLWTIDVLVLRRVGTSLIFPEHMRALEWSQRRLESTGRVRYHRQPNSRSDLVARPTQADLQREVSFGQVPVPLWRAIIEACVARYAVTKLNAYHFPLPVDQGTFYMLSLGEQYLFALCVGSQIAFGASLPDYVSVKALRPLVPVTANLTSFSAPASATSLSDLWGNRWHTFSRRDLWRIASLLFPFGSTRVGNVVGAFFFSGVFHSLLFLRALQPNPFWSGSIWTDVQKWLPVFFQPGIVAFFTAHGLICVAERLILDSRHPTLVGLRDAYERHLPAWLRQALGILYTWTMLLYTARWAAADAIQTGVLTRENTHSLTMGAMWADVQAYFSSPSSTK